MVSSIDRTSRFLSLGTEVKGERVCGNDTEKSLRLQWILVNPPPLYPPNFKHAIISQYQYNVQVPMNIQLIRQTR